MLTTPSITADVAFQSKVSSGTNGADSVMQLQFCDSNAKLSAILLYLNKNFTPVSFSLDFAFSS